MRTVAGVKSWRVSATTGLEALLVLLACGVAACGPSPATSSKSSTGPPVSQASPSVTPNPRALAPNDCTAPPPSNGATVHSVALGASVTLPPDWAEDPTMEGQQGLMAALDLSFGTRPNDVNISADLLPVAMSPDDAINSMTSQPGSGTVIAKGDCTIAGGKAAYIESTMSASLFPGITFSGSGYSVVIAHGSKLVYLIILLPSDSGDSMMPAVKSILGSWQWDQA
jgi:hypothetical protein